jgi:hypothetical protein
MNRLGAIIEEKTRESANIGILDTAKKDGVSHSEIRNVLLKYNVRWRHSKTMLGGSRDPEYELKKSVLKS